MAAVTMTAQQRMMKATDMVDDPTGSADGQLVVSRTLEEHAALTDRLIAWQRATGGCATFFADGTVTLEWTEADVLSVTAESLAEALDLAV
jgi:hypothetical protein